VNHPITLESVDLAQTGTFICSTAGHTCNINFHWRIESGSFPSKVTGVNTNTLVIPDVRSSDNNNYTCVASNGAGSSTAAVTQLKVTGMSIMMLLGGDVNVVLMVQVYQR